MRLAKSIAKGGEVVDARTGDYEVSIKDTIICIHCRFPVYWRQGSAYQKKGSLIKIPACWVHYPGADKDCPFYFNQEIVASKSILGYRSKGQREKLLLARFWRILRLAVSANLEKNTADRVREILRDRSVLPRNFLNRYSPLGKEELKQFYLDSFLEDLTDRVKSSRADCTKTILAQSNCPKLEKAIAAEALEFFAIDKNQSLLTQLALCAIDAHYRDQIPNVLDFKRDETKELVSVVEKYLLEAFLDTNFAQAYLLEENNYLTGEESKKDADL